MSVVHNTRSAIAVLAPTPGLDRRAHASQCTRIKVGKAYPVAYGFEAGDEIPFLVAQQTAVVVYRRVLAVTYFHNIAALNR
jgi:hypothetical protein